MKKIVNRIILALVVLSMAGAMAFAKEKSEKVTFSRDMVVNGTVVKKGTYRVKYDDQAKELSIWDGKTAVVKSTVRLETAKSKTSSTKVIYIEKDNSNVLNSITFAGSAEAMVINEGGNQTASPQ
jgi:hypothetical protein